MDRVSAEHRDQPAAQLRAWPDDRVARLLRDRPDVATPAPRDCAQLAARTAVASSVRRALAHLTRLELGVLDALVVQSRHQPVRRETLASLVHAAPESVDAALARLADLALIWPLATGYTVPTVLPRVLDRVSGIAPLGEHPLAAETITARVERLDEPTRELLDHLAANGATATASRRGAGRRARPVTDLVREGLLRWVSDTALEVPGEVVLWLRSGRTTLDPVDVTPALTTTPVDATRVEDAAAAAAQEFVGRVATMLQGWELAPPRVLTTGGLAVRDLGAVGDRLHVDSPTAALVVETAASAGLLAVGADADGASVWLPTPGYDSWSLRPEAHRWLVLAQAWLRQDQRPWLAGTKDDQGRPRHALSGTSDQQLPEVRRLVLEQLALLTHGSALAADGGEASVAARVGWLRPRWPASASESAVWCVRGATELGLLGAGALSEAGRALVAADPVTAEERMADTLPQPLREFLLQADLTAVAPGVLAADIAQGLQAMADVESRGGATVHRFTPSSIRRAFDAGWSAAEVHEFLAVTSATPVPQPLTYLVDDLSRSHGSVRVGRAEAFLRCDDPALLSALLADPRTAPLGLRRLAPTVVISTALPDVLLPLLRDLGAMPVLEDETGAVRIARPDPRRAAASAARRAAARPAPQRLDRIVAAIRAGDRAAAGRTQARAASPTDIATALRAAIEAAESVLIDYVDNQGTTTRRLIRPERFDAGWLRGYDTRADEHRIFAAHRISVVWPAGQAAIDDADTAG